MFARRRRLLGALCQIVEKLLREADTAAKPGGREALILFVQTFGDLVTFNPHINVLAADGVFVEDGTFFVLPPVPHRLLERRFRTEVLRCCCAKGKYRKIWCNESPPGAIPDSRSTTVCAFATPPGGNGSRSTCCGRPFPWRK